MAMTYATLTGGKNASGSIASWVNYSKLDIPTILDEAQSMLYGMLRTREMITRYAFSMPEGNTYSPLPARFLDPIGTMYVPSLNMRFNYKDVSYVNDRRIYNTVTGAFAASAFATTIGSSDVSVTLSGHGFTQASTITIVGASAVGGLIPNGTFDVTAITDANTFVIDASALGAATSTATGGGASPTYTCSIVQKGSPYYWSIWNEQMQFDFAFVTTMTVMINYYQSLPLLSATNLTNFLTNRYPKLLRVACVASAADFMKDSEEYNKGLQALVGLVQGVNVEDDMHWRSMDLETETP
jgi:hypothetical protein